MMVPSGSPHGRQNRHWRLLNACWLLLSRLDRQIGECTAVVHNAYTVLKRNYYIVC